MPTSPSSAPDLKQRWNAFRDRHPDVRIRTAADRMGVSEAELVATGCGEHVTRLRDGWRALLSRLHTLGPVTALTRNDAAVHETTGVYRDIEFTGTHNLGLVLEDNIDLRLFMDHWHLGFAVETPRDGERGDVRRSLQFFDRDGTAVHRVFLTRESDRDAYDALVDAHRHDDQSPEQSIARGEDNTSATSQSEGGSGPQTAPDSDIDVEEFLHDWSELEDTHDFFPLLSEYDVSRGQALRLGEGRFTRRVPDTALRHTLQAAAEQETPIMVFVGSPGCLQIHTGPVQTLKATPPWYNVLDPDFQLRLNEERIDQAWVVQKPTTDGRVTSLELMDANGGIIARLFGERKDGQSERADWRSILEGQPSAP
ncbi:hemin-degrading factor [Salinibacter grassmerensis]|uniref:hemin-degrading factor n=1 Tax=Salinibacter grassmerensis TaxID=3040353 RepID=UPI0021E8BDA4|nr:ChuX/HutX family heme-like substrate-binding protein [Salinibacter grassmerensis]